MILIDDIRRTYDFTPGSTLKKVVTCWRSPGVHAVIVLRFGQWLKRQNVLIQAVLSLFYLAGFHRMRSKWGIEIPRETEIGSGFYIGHFGSIIISPETRIGKNFSISQNVTIGISGQGEKRGCPTIGSDVYVAPGAKIFGKITIGNHVKIGANAVVYKDIPDDVIVVLDPGFKLKPLER